MPVDSIAPWALGLLLTIIVRICLLKKSFLLEPSLGLFRLLQFVPVANEYLLLFVNKALPQNCKFFALFVQQLAQSLIALS